MSRPILALLAFLVFIVGGILGWVTRDSDFGANLVSGNGGEDSGFVQVSAPEQAQLVSVMAALDVPATPQSGLSGDNLVNISAALSALQDRSNQVAAAFAERDKAVEQARQEGRIRDAGCRGVVDGSLTVAKMGVGSAEPPERRRGYAERELQSR